MADRRGLWALLAALTVSTAGTRMSQLAVPWLVLTTTHSPVLTGLVSTAEIAPYVLLQVLGAPLVDRLGGRRVAVLSNLVAAAAMGSIPVIWDAGTRQIWPVLGLVFLAGLARGPADPATSLLLPQVTARAGMAIDRSTALSDGAVRLASLLALPAGGVLIGVLGAANVTALDAASFLVATGLILLLVPSANLEQQPGRPAGYRAELREGVGYVLRHPLLRRICGMVFFTNLADAAMSGMLLLLWVRQHGAGADRVGLVGGVFGVGAVVGTSLMVAIGGRLPRRPVYALAFLIGGPPRFLALLLPLPFPAVLAVWLVAGAAGGAINPVLSAAEYDLVPEPLVARTFSTIGALAWAGIPFGALAASGLIAAHGLAFALAVGGGLYLVATADPFLCKAWAGMNRVAPAPCPAEVAA